MKKLLFFLNIFFVVISFSCKENNKEKKTIIQNNSFKNKVVFKIDERTEFMRIIYNIALQEEFPEDIQPCQTQYFNRINNHFKPFKNHPLIQSIYNNQNIGVDFSTIGLMFEDLESFEFNETYSKELKMYNISEQTIDSLVPLMKNFYQKSEFAKFFENNKSYYQKSISKIEKQVTEENLLDKITKFYQSKQKGLELIVFVELTNNANNKAVRFYDNYNPNKRAVILGNFCDLPNESSTSNEFMELNNSIRGVIYHETSHLFTDKLLEKNIGEINQYETICKNCNELEIMDKVDHLVIFPLQAIIMQKFDNNNEGNNFYLNECTDVRKDIYKKLMNYKPENRIPFEKTYIDCINLIKETIPKQ